MTWSAKRTTAVATLRNFWLSSFCLLSSAVGEDEVPEAGSVPVDVVVPSVAQSKHWKSLRPSEYSSTVSFLFESVAAQVDALSPAEASALAIAIAPAGEVLILETFVLPVIPTLATALLEPLPPFFLLPSDGLTFFVAYLQTYRVFTFLEFRIKEYRKDAPLITCLLELLELVSGVGLGCSS
uniref:Secreted protein n=1 Tax=Glossina pallidipes TaxID=7398 RepID=A0A1A9ZUQ8_GLOPL